jgi:hypothetical protein
MNSNSINKNYFENDNIYLDGGTGANTNAFGRALNNN